MANEVIFAYVAQEDKNKKCKDCKFYRKDCYGHSGRCQLMRERYPENNPLFGCNKVACIEFQQRK